MNEGSRARQKKTMGQKKTRWQKAKVEMDDGEFDVVRERAFTLALPALTLLSAELRERLPGALWEFGRDVVLHRILDDDLDPQLIEEYRRKAGPYREPVDVQVEEYAEKAGARASMEVLVCGLRSAVDRGDFMATASFAVAFDVILAFKLDDVDPDAFEDREYDTGVAVREEEILDSIRKDYSEVADGMPGNASARLEKTGAAWRTRIEGILVRPGGDFAVRRDRRAIVLPEARAAGLRAVRNFAIRRGDFETTAVAAFAIADWAVDLVKDARRGRRVAGAQGHHRAIAPRRRPAG